MSTSAVETIDREETAAAAAAAAGGGGCSRGGGGGSGSRSTAPSTKSSSESGDSRSDNSSAETVGIDAGSYGSGMGVRQPALADGMVGSDDGTVWTAALEGRAQQPG